MAVTWKNVKDLFYEAVGDNESVGAFFSTSQVYAWGQECMREAATRTHFRDLKYEQVTVASTSTYATSSAGEAFKVYRVEIEGEYLRPINADQIRKYDRFWQSRTSSSPSWYLLDEYQTDPDNIMVRFYETPSVDDLAYRVYSYAYPLALPSVDDTQKVHLPEWFAYSLVFGMLKHAYEADTQMMNQEMADFWGMMWEDAIMRLRIRSFSRLPSEWSYNPIEQDGSLSIWNRLPESIPEP